MPKKRSNGEGGISYDKSRDSYIASVTTPTGKRIFKRFKENSDAVAWKTEQIRNMHTGTFVNPSNLLLGEWIVQWLVTYKKPVLKQRTFERYQSLLTHTMPLSGLKTQEIKPLHVQQLYQSLSPRLSNSTINKVHKILKSAFKKAYQLEMIQKDIMTLVVPPKTEKKEIETFTIEEIDKILSYCESDTVLKKYYPMILIAATTGMRLGEVLGLRWCDVDLANSTLFIRKSLQSSDKLGLILETPKTKASVRKIKILEKCVNQLRKLKDKSLNNSGENLCFVTRNQTPIAPRNFERIWNLLLDKKHANVKYKNFHVLRHTHATELLGNGVTLSDVAKRLGHSRQSHTLELYAHALPNHDEVILDAIEKIYS